MKHPAQYILAFAILIAIGSCKIYSFSGASIPADVKTVTVELFRNVANNGPAQLSQTVTEKLKTKFVNEASLKQVNNDGDLVFKGSITGYSFSSIAPTAQIQSGYNRLTITMQVSYESRKYPKDSWKQPEVFTDFADVAGSQNLSAVENQLIDDILKRMVDNIFNKAMVKW